ncbi:neurotrypsin-like [Amphiura filiformis]|uniref:neurotrypsin-like n=1 Tax=Amphiura filiformis TaxID=82378 RepID=UPI003B227D1A
MLDTAQVRLVDGIDPNEGRVEILHNGEWGTVCDDDWSKQDAIVVCRQIMGIHHGVLQAEAYSSAWFGQGSGNILLDDVQCTGNENFLNECSHAGWRFNDCTHEEDAAVICRNGKGTLFKFQDTNTSTEVRLVNGTVPGEGRVEVMHHGEWGTICYAGWTLMTPPSYCAGSLVGLVWLKVMAVSDLVKALVTYFWIALSVMVRRVG